MGIRDTLSEAARGQAEAARSLTETIYAELREIAGRRMQGERVGHTLQATALLNEAMARLLGTERVSAKDRQHFIALSSRAMQRVLIDHGRRRGADRRGGGATRLSLEDVQPAAPLGSDELEHIAEALEQLERIDPRKGQIARLRLLGGMAVPEVAEVLTVSTNTVDRDWKLAKEWLVKSLG